MIPQTTIDRIIDSANIVDVVSQYVTLRRAGANFKGLCPFHDDKTPSFHVSPSKGICKCFACGEGGNVVQFIMKKEQMTYVEALRHLGKRYGIEVEERELSDNERRLISERESMFAVNEWASNYYHNVLHNHPDGRAVGLAYFRSRGFRDDIIKKFRLGYAVDSWDAMSKEALKSGYAEKYLINDAVTKLGTGLSFKRDNGSLIDKFRGRVIFPWFNAGGKIVAFGGRVLDSRTKGVAQKYINSSESIIYTKGRELYGLYQARTQITKEDCVYMVEGYTDVLSMHQCGIENVVANSGTALSEAQIHLLHRFTANITLLYDGDDAGVHAALRGTDMLLADGMNVKILLLPDGDDPDSFARKHTATEFKDYVEKHQTDFIIFKTNLLLKDAGHDPLKRANLTKDIVYSISVIPEEIVRNAYIHECSELLGVEEAVLLRETMKNRKRALEELQRAKQREEMRARDEAMREAQQQAAAVGNQGQGSQQASSGSGVQTAPATGTQGSPAIVTQTSTTTGTQASSATGTQTSSVAGAPTATPADNPTYAGMSPEEIEAFEAMYGDMPSQAPVQQAPAAAPLIETALSRDAKRFVGIERMIMTLVVRYGNSMIELVDQENNIFKVRLTEYVNSELESDGLQFRSPLYASMMQSCMEHIKEESFDVTRFLVNNQDQEISAEAVNLLSEKYQLSKRFEGMSEEEMAPGYVQRLMLDYKNLIIEEELKKCKQALADPQVSADPARCNEIMQRYMQYNNIKRTLAKALGDRVLQK